MAIRDAVLAMGVLYGIEGCRLSISGMEPAMPKPMAALHLQKPAKAEPADVAFTDAGGGQRHTLASYQGPLCAFEHVGDLVRPLRRRAAGS